MYRVILIDDEYWICHGLQEMVDWASLDMEVIGTADNAFTARSLCERELPDIIITDINMPNMNGLDLIAELNKTCPDSVMIIISGHDEFSYAKKAVNLHVFDYLLKPLNIEELVDVLKRAREVLVRNDDAKRIAEETNRLMESTGEVFREWLVNRILTGMMRQEDILPAQREILGPLEHACNCVIMVETEEVSDKKGDMPISDYEYLLSRIRMVVETSDSMITMPQYNDANRVSLYVCCFDQDESTLREKITHCTQKLQKELLEMHLVSTIACGMIQNSIYDIRTSLHQANIACQRKFIYGKNRVFFYDEPPAQGTQERVTPQDIQYADIAASFVFGRQIDYDSLFDDIRHLIQARDDEPHNYLYSIVQNLEFKLLEELSKLPFGAELMFNPFSTTHEITKKETMDEILDALRTQMEGLAAQITERQHDETNIYINKSLHYLNQHYAESDLSLKTIARTANMSVSYFCSKFKQVTGRSCIAYLTDIRLNKAKQLLDGTDLRVHEIAQRVGYGNSAYFCTAFKNYVGCTPETYRATSRKQGE